MAASAPRGSGDGDEALSARRGRAVLLHEARALPPGLDLALLDRALLRERHRLPDHAGPPRAPLGREPRMHRPEPVVRAVRRRGPAGLSVPLRPRPGSGRDVREGARERPSRARGARGAGQLAGWRPLNRADDPPPSGRARAR